MGPTNPPVPLCTHCNLRPRHITASGKLEWRCLECIRAYNSDRKAEERAQRALLQPPTPSTPAAPALDDDHDHDPIREVIADMSALIDHAREVARTDKLALQMTLVAEGAIIRMGVEKERDDA